MLSIVDLLHVKGNLQAILSEYAEIEFKILKQTVSAESHSELRFERDIEITGESIHVKAHSLIITEHRELETDSIGKFLNKKEIEFQLLESKWICLSCAMAIHMDCKHITFKPLLCRKYTLKTDGFDALIVEVFIKLPF